MVGSSCFTSDTRRVAYAHNLVISHIRFKTNHERGKDGFSGRVAIPPPLIVVLALDCQLGFVFNQ